MRVAIILAVTLLAATPTFAQYDDSYRQRQEQENYEADMQRQDREREQEREQQAEEQVREQQMEEQQRQAETPAERLGDCAYAHDCQGAFAP